MNIIIVAKPLSSPKVVSFGSRRAKAIGISLLGLMFVTTVVVGGVIGAKFFGPMRAKMQLVAAQNELSEQRGELATMKAKIVRDMDALAMRLGRLQAQATRLNALGERLAKMGKLEDGEFDFNEEPALGGPDTVQAQSALDIAEVSTALERLEKQFQHQTQQLGMLDMVLFDREVDQSLMPTGMPVKAGYISSGFGYRADPFSGRGEFHSGVDFNGSKGSEVLAVAGGVVAYSDVRAGYGNMIEIDHGNGYHTRYAHNDKNLVQVGDPVRAGDVIAKMGSTGRSTGNHVHFEVWLNGQLVNPVEYIQAMR